MRYLFGLAFILLLSASAAKTPDRNAYISFTPILLDRDQPERRTFGALELLGAWKLGSNNAMFGGISSMRIDRGRFTALSDVAHLFTFSFDGSQTLSPVRVRPLPGIFSPKNPSPDRDSESMTTDPQTGRMWVGFEASNSIRSFSPRFGKKTGWVAPPKMRQWPENAGPEAMVRLTDGRFIVFGEEVPSPIKGTTEGLLFLADPIHAAQFANRFYYRPPDGYDPTDAAQLPDGRVLILNRHFSIFDGVAAALTIIDPQDIVPDQVVRSRVVAILTPPLNIDNMEAMAIEARDGKIIVWIASDDNFNPLQQNLLFKFALDPSRIR